MKAKKKLEDATPGFEPASQLPSAKKVLPLTTGLCDRCVNERLKLILLKHLSLPFTLFEPYGTVFIMNSKMYLVLIKMITTALSSDKIVTNNS